MDKKTSTHNSKVIKASQEVLYRAFTDPAALAIWLAPGEMTSKIHSFDFRIGGGYQMSLFYPSTGKTLWGKTSEREDRFTVTFVDLTPPKRIIQVVNFHSDNPVFSGEMTMDISFEAIGSDTTKVIITFSDIPPGISAEDNEAGTQSSLEKLARYVEVKPALNNL